ncbi:hypothetical protein HDG70_002302 [Carboxydothermus ferrireducens DSM 11255]|uniref:Uncharacterized protein n=2 Tax=Carboxydothermus TaxID=129957 RepID=Q3AB63_CARHZ|nr:hypothetical protein CHY_1801 [Carboxydothermus hydrogenoformans Z-2901]NYE58551.1 hypothetical protein [Carboxydothermus ferrireducens DSM 11255]
MRKKRVFRVKRRPLEICENYYVVSEKKGDGRGELP